MHPVNTNIESENFKITPTSTLGCQSWN